MASVSVFGSVEGSAEMESLSSANCFHSYHTVAPVGSQPQRGCKHDTDVGVKVCPCHSKPTPTPGPMLTGELYAFKSIL